MRKVYDGMVKTLEVNQYFVMGTNTQGRHGKGSALHARLHFGAVYGQPMGFQGKCYAIITKDLTRKIYPSVKREDIIEQIKTLYYAAKTIAKDKEFLVSYNGTHPHLKHLCNYSSHELATMFVDAGPIPDNIIFERNFAHLVEVIGSGTIKND